MSNGDKDKDSWKFENFWAPDAEMNDKIPEKTIPPTLSIKKAPSMPKKRLTFADQLPQDSTLPSVGRAPTTKKIPSSGKEEDNEAEGAKPTTFRKTPTVRKSPTFAEETVDDSKGKRPTVATPIPSPVPPPPIPPLNIQPAVPPKQETEVDAWEREERTKIKER